MESTQDMQYGKMFPEHTRQTKVKILGEFSKKSQKPKFQYLQVESGQDREWYELNDVSLLGELSMPSIGEFPSVAAESTLSQILEADAPQKYYLSPKACQGILRRAEKRGKELPKLLKATLKAQADGKFLVTSGQEFKSAGFIGKASPSAGSVGYCPEMASTLKAEQITHVIQSEILDMTHANDVIRECGDTCPTLQARMGTGGNQIPLVFEPTYCIQGNTIDRSDTAGANGKGVLEGGSYTLNTVDRHAVCHSIGFCPNNSETAVGLSEVTVTRWNKEEGTGFGLGEDGEPVYTLQEAHSHSVIYAIDRAAFNQGENAKYDFQIDDSDVNSTIVARDPSAVCYKISCKEISETLDTHCCNNLFVWVVRRLTPRECERLQGFPDDWTMYDTNGNEFKDTPRYKALGNSIAIPCALRVFKGIVKG